MDIRSEDTDTDTGPPRKINARWSLEPLRTVLHQFIPVEDFCKRLNIPHFQYRETVRWWQVWKWHWTWTLDYHLSRVLDHAFALDVARTLAQELGGNVESPHG